MFDITLKIIFKRNVSNGELQGFCDELTGAFFVRKRISHVSYERSKGDIFIFIRVDVSKKLVTAMSKIMFQVFSEGILHPHKTELLKVTKVETNSKIKVIIQEKKEDIKCQKN